jgi:hypothetical protein
MLSRARLSRESFYVTSDSPVNVSTGRAATRKYWEESVDDGGISHLFVILTRGNPVGEVTLVGVVLAHQIERAELGVLCNK